MKEYIERNDLIRELEDDLANDINMYNSHIDKEIRDDKICFACDVLASAPAADVRKVVHAKWLGKPLGGYSTVKCSNCNMSFKENNGRWKYCPECGAKMDLK